MKKLKLFGAVSLSLLMSTSANADISFNGFASIFGGYTTGTEGEFLGYDDSFSADPNTLIGLQAIADLDEGLSATVQLTARGDNDYEVELEWGYLSYQVNDQVRINAGRIRVPFFNRSDFLDVGYAYYWVRPPTSVYDVAISNITGVSALYNVPVGNWDISAQVLGGRNGTADLAGSDFEVENFVGGSIELNRDWFTFRAAIFRTTISLDSAFINTNAQSIRDAGFTALGDNLAVDNDTSVFSHLGISIDKNNFLFNAEYRVIDVEEGALQERPAWYASIGYRFGSFTPNITFETIETEVPDNIQNLLNDASGSSVATANILLGAFAANESAVSFGVRYDFHPSAAFKVDFTTFSDDLNEAGDANLLTLGVDLVF